MTENENEMARDKYRRDLSTEDEEILSDWWQSLLTHNVRIHSKKLILKLAARSMADPEFRARLVNDFPRLRAEMNAEAEAQLPAGITLNFLENTEETLNIVLPRPLRDVPEDERPPLQDLLRSHTVPGKSSSFFSDDFRDHGNWYDYGPFLAPGDQGDVNKDRGSTLPR